MNRSTECKHKPIPEIENKLYPDYDHGSYQRMYIEHLKNKTREVKEIEMKRRKLLRAVAVTLGVLEDYDRNKDKLRNYRAMEKQVNDLQQQLNYYKNSGKIYLNVNNSITEDDLVKMLHYLCHNPIINMDIIHTLQKRALGISLVMNLQEPPKINEQGIENDYKSIQKDEPNFVVLSLR